MMKKVDTSSGHLGPGNFLDSCTSGYTQVSSSFYSGMFDCELVVLNPVLLCWIFCFNIWPNLDFWAESESGGQYWLGTQHMDFYLFRFGGKGCAKGKVKVV